MGFSNQVLGGVLWFFKLVNKLKIYNAICYWQ